MHTTHEICDRQDPPTDRTPVEVSSGASALYVGKAILEDSVAFRPILARVTGSVTAALMVSQALYWMKVKDRIEPDAGGWFYKTQEEWTEEICLSRCEQETARRILRRFDFWEEKRRGVPARLFFRVDWERLCAAVIQYAGKSHSGEVADKSAGNQHSFKGAKTTSEITNIDFKAPPAETLRDWIPIDTWAAFREMRIRNKKPLTEHAVELVIRELEKLRSAGNDPREVLEQSILNSWAGVFEVKKHGNTGNAGQPRRNGAGRISRGATGALTAPTGKYSARRANVAATV